MKTRLFCVIVLLIVNATLILGQVDNSKPEIVAEKFLELYFAGDWFKACTNYSTPDCDTQLSFMLKVMETDDKYIDEGKCSFVIDSCKINKDGVTAECFYTKTCSVTLKPKKHKLMLKFMNNKWLVEYLWKRDKYL